MPETTIWLLRIEHRHGDDILPCRSYEDAVAWLLTYVQDWWTDELGDEPQPADAAAAITRYFALNEDESYTITTAPLWSAAERQEA